jgi:hypothetical protein
MHDRRDNRFARRSDGCYEEETAHLIKVFDEISPDDANRVAEALKVAYARCSTDPSVWRGISPT